MWTAVRERPAAEVWFAITTTMNMNVHGSSKMAAKNGTYAVWAMVHFRRDGIGGSEAGLSAGGFGMCVWRHFTAAVASAPMVRL